MSCLSGYIGLKYCGEATSPQSSIYINSLQGINLDLLAKLSEGEQKGFLDVWADIEQRAIMRLSNDITGYLSKKYFLAQIQRSYNLQKTLNPNAPALTGNKWHGITFDIRGGTGDYQPSALSYINVQTLCFKVDTPDVGKVITCKIFDLLTGEELFTKSVTCVLGWNTVQINKRLINEYLDRAKYVFICVDLTAISAYSKTINEEECDLIIKGAYSNTTSGIFATNVVEGNNSFGVTVVATQGCSYDAIVCHNKEIFTRSLLYALGVETMLETLASQRMSKYTTTGKDRAEKNLADYTVDYDKSLANALDGILLNLGDNCLECNASVTIKNFIP